MTYDDYTGEWLKPCQECGKLKWHEHGSSICDDCKESESTEGTNQ